MSTAGEQTLAQEQTPQTGSGSSRSALQISGALRLGIAAIVSGAITAVIIVHKWDPLSVKSTVVGYPIAYDFNPYNYSHGYDLTVVLFPLLTFVLFYGLTWLGPRVGIPTPGPRGRLRPLGPEPLVEQVADPIYANETFRRVSGAGRVVFVGAVLGIEVAVAADHLWPDLALTAAGYCLLVALVAALLTRVVPDRLDFEAAVSVSNAVAAALTLAGLVLVSAHTELTVTAGNLRHNYPWCPPWVGLPLAFLAAVGILFALRRAGPTRVKVVERWTVLLLAAPVALWVLSAVLPGDQGQLGLFERGQQVTEAMLIGHGWLPWKDVFLAHGLLGDILPVAAGWGVLGNSYWGATGGFFLLLNPLSIVLTFLLMAYLAQRRWPLVFIAGLIFLGPWLGAVVDPAYCLWPPILLLLAMFLRRFTRWRAIALGALVVAQAIVSDEMVPCVVIVLVTVAAYEWYWRAPDTDLRVTFRRTVWLAPTILVAGAAFAIYMAARGALGAVIYDTLALVPGHTLDGGNPPTIAPGSPEPVFEFVAIAPIVAVLISMAYALIHLRLRRPFLLADWPMGAAAVYVFFYYTKFLARMDEGHAYEVFVVATPLMLYIVYRAVAAADDWIRTVPSIDRSRWARWVPAYPVAIALLAYLVIAFWGPLTARVKASPSNYRAGSPVAATVERVGYSSDVDAPAIRDFRKIFDAYLGPRGRVFDFTNEPGLFYYFLNRKPSTRWFAPNGLVQTPQLQNNLIGDLRRDPPKLIVFDDTDTTMYGLEAMDGIPVSSRVYLVSRWILQHYKPLMVIHNRVIYALRSVHPIPPAQLHLIQQPIMHGVQFLGQSCLWGDSPSFLSGAAQPPSGATSVPARIIARQGQSQTLTGWAGDARSGSPARSVIATLDGRVVARTTPSLYRPDLPAAGLPAGFAGSGFQMSVPAQDFIPGRLRVYAIDRNGSVIQLPVAGQKPQTGRVMIAGRSVRLQPKAVKGHIDTQAAAAPYIKIAPPAGSSWADFPWLEIGGLRQGTFVPGEFTLADIPGTAVATNFGRYLAFNSIPTSSYHFIVPAASCQQWQGYGSQPLYLTPPIGQSTPTVRLIR